MKNKISVSQSSKVLPKGEEDMGTCGQDPKRRRAYTWRGVPSASVVDGRR